MTCLNDIVIGNYDSSISFFYSLCVRTSIYLPDAFKKKRHNNVLHISAFLKSTHLCICTCLWIGMASCPHCTPPLRVSLAKRYYAFPKSTHTNLHFICNLQVRKCHSHGPQRNKPWCAKWNCFRPLFPRTSSQTLHSRLTYACLDCEPGICISPSPIRESTRSSG